MKPAKEVGAPMVYPFVTKRQVSDRLDRDPEFVRECIGILHRRFVDRDVLPPPAGWMSSHRKLGEAVFARMSSSDFTAADVATAAKLAKRYAKQLCKVFRDEQLAREPGLAIAAAVFGVARPDLDDGDDPYAEPEAEDAENDAPRGDGAEEVEERVTADASVGAETGPVVSLTQGQPRRRRPGRPKGSKNKPKADGAQKQGKRGRRR